MDAIKALKKLDPIFRKQEEAHRKMMDDERLRRGADPFLRITEADPLNKQRNEEETKTHVVKGPPLGNPIPHCSR